MFESPASNTKNRRMSCFILIFSLSGIVDYFLLMQISPLFICSTTVMVLVLGICAYLLLTQFRTILDIAFTAYTMVGAGLTPALLAAFLLKRVTTAGGVASIATGMGATLIITVINSVLPEPLIPFDYIVLPAAGLSIAVLIIVSLMTPPDPKEKWEKFYL